MVANSLELLLASPKLLPRHKTSQWCSSRWCFWKVIEKNNWSRTLHTLYSIFSMEGIMKYSLLYFLECSICHPFPSRRDMFSGEYLVTVWFHCCCKQNRFYWLYKKMYTLRIAENVINLYFDWHKVLRLVTISVRQEIRKAVGREVFIVLYLWHKALVY